MKDGKCFNASVYNKYQQRVRSNVKLSPTDIYYSLQGAVVSIFARTPLGDDAYAEKIGTGFFVASDRILTAASVVLYDDSQGEREPPTNAGVDIVRAQSFFVRVQNVRNKGDAYFYTAILKYVSPSFDVAMLEVLPPIDKCTPSINAHSVLKFADSRCTAIGEKVYTMGDYLNHEAIGIVEGTVLDNVYNDPRTFHDNDGNWNRNFWGFEAVLSDMEIREGNIGGPLLNEYGRVVGLISGADQDNEWVDPSDNVERYPVDFFHGYSRVVAVSEHVLRPIVETFLAGPADEKYGCRLQLVRDPLGNFYRFIYGYLGVTAYEAFGPKYLELVPNSKYRRQRGYILLGVQDTVVANGVPGYVSPLDPGTGPFPNIYNPHNSDPISPDNELYLLTSINGNPLGVGDGQVTFTTVTRLHCKGDVVEIHYRLGSEDFGKSHAVQVQLQELPQSSDFPPNFWRSDPVSRGLKKNDAQRAVLERSLGGKKVLDILLKLAGKAQSIFKFIDDHALEILDDNGDGEVTIAEGLSNALELGSAIVSAIGNDGLPTSAESAADLVLDAAEGMIPEQPASEQPDSEQPTSAQ
jgi:S1-C subfamily serine protease